MKPSNVNTAKVIFIGTFGLPRRLVWSGAIIGLGTVPAYFLLQQPARSQKTPKVLSPLSQYKSAVIPVETVRVGNSLEAPPILVSGQIEAGRVATVSAEVADRVNARPIRRGERIKAGQLLVLLNEDLARAQLAQAAAAMSGVRAARLQAEAEYSRAKIETQSAQLAARAALEGAEAGEAKARSLTRTQELGQAEAALVAAEADTQLARKDFDRYEKLVEEDAVPRQTLDRARAALDAAIARQHAAEESVSLAREGARREDIIAARAQVQSARASVLTAATRPQRLEAIRRQIDTLKAQESEASSRWTQARIALTKRRITAPFSGLVLETFVESGEMAFPNQPVIRIGNVGRVKAVFSVSEDMRPLLPVGRNATFTADAFPGRVWTGHVLATSGEADARARTFRVELEAANPQIRLLPNMVARLHLPRQHSPQAATVPVSAVAATPDGAAVFVIRNNRALRRLITLGTPLGDRVTAVSGLVSGEIIAATPQRLTDNAPVRVQTRTTSR